jgi:signal transduction histidine kinase
MPPEKTPAERVRAHPFLALFDDRLAALLAESAEIRKCNPGERIFSEGEVADSIFLVLEGSIRLTKKDPDGKDQLLAIVEARDYFGEFGVLDGHARSAGALAAVPGTVLARLPRELVNRVFAEAGSQGILKMALQIIRKVRETNDMVVTERLRKERMTLVGEMAGMIIHDLRNPFTVIQLCVQMLRGEVPPGAMEKCDLIAAQLDRAKDMVEELLEFSRGATQLNLQPADVAGVLTQFDKLFREYLALSHVELSVTSVSRVVALDPKRILRVLQNLANNAVEAMDGRGGRIEITCEDRGRSVAITVADNGPGIPPEAQATLFEPFAAAGKRKSLGLGMAIAKSIVTAHGGQLTFTSGAGGTRFTMELKADGAA